MSPPVTSSRTSLPSLPPERVGPYEILAPIASGGMATVYLARSLGTVERLVALKLTHAHLRESAEFANELLEEAKLVAHLSHANVVQVLDVGDDVHGLYLAMDYVEGDSLSGLRRAVSPEPIPPSVGIRVLVDALFGLHAAHELRGPDGAPLGLVHRDFSPQNILVGVDGIARLGDFGVAKAATRLSQTRTGLVKGKVTYMAPEQARGADLDRRADVWAAGVIAWELFSGKRLYSGDNELATMLRIVNEDPPRLRTVADVSAEVDAVVAAALARDAEKRTPTAAAFAQALAGATKGMLADTGEVADFVAHAVGASLRERRLALEEALERSRTTRALPRVLDPLDPATATDTNSVATAETRLTMRRRPWPALAAGAIALGVLAVVALARRSEKDVPAASPVSSATPMACAEGPPAAVPADALPEPQKIAVPDGALTVEASAPIVSIQIGDRTVVMPKPSRTVVVERSPDERSRTVEITALAADGRRADASVPPSASSATLAFSTAQTPPPTAAPKPKKPRGVHLAPSPYE